MSESNNLLRKQAVPYTSWWVRDFEGSSASRILATCPILTAGRLLEAYLTMFLPVTSSMSVRVAVGRFEEDGITPVRSYSNAEINESHHRITGSPTPIASASGVLALDGYNLLNDMRANDRAFVLLLDFSRNMSVPEQRRLFDQDLLLITASSTMGLV